MKDIPRVVIRMTSKEQLKALPILLGHWPGMVLPGRVYILREGAAKALSKAGVRFRLICREGAAPHPGEPIKGRRL